MRLDLRGMTAAVDSGRPGPPRRRESASGAGAQGGVGSSAVRMRTHTRAPALRIFRWMRVFCAGERRAPKWARGKGARQKVRAKRCAPKWARARDARGQKRGAALHAPPRSSKLQALLLPLGPIHQQLAALFCMALIRAAGVRSRFAPVQCGRCCPQSDPLRGTIISLGGDYPWRRAAPRTAQSLAAPVFYPPQLRVAPAQGAPCG